MNNLLFINGLNHTAISIAVERNSSSIEGTWATCPKIQATISMTVCYSDLGKDKRKNFELTSRSNIYILAT